MDLNLQTCGRRAKKRTEKPRALAKYTMDIPRGRGRKTASKDLDLPGPHWFVTIRKSGIKKGAV